MMIHYVVGLMSLGLISFYQQRKILNNNSVYG